MAMTQTVCLDEILGYFDVLEDPRSTVNQKHPLVSIVVIAMKAVLAGAGGPTAIARWAACQAEFLSKVLKLPNGIPRKDVFRRVLALLKPDAFPTCFSAWLQSLRAGAAASTDVDQPVLAIAGQTARRSHDRNKGRGALRAVAAGVTDAGGELRQLLVCGSKVARDENQVRRQQEVEEPHEGPADDPLLRHAETAQPEQGRQQDQTGLQKANRHAQEIGEQHIKSAYPTAEKGNREA
jgi:hypothetical protein